MPDNENKKKIIKKIPRKPNRRSRPKVHDAFLKMFYRYPKVVSSLITKFIPKALIGEFDPNSLERQPDTFHNSKLSERREDLIWKVKTINGDVIYLYLLLEFQSQSLFLMPFRILEYTALFISSFKRICRR
ncbi:MAG: Rpn family recombination-promoting nuclease/putative transposase [Desulfovibrio sp.]|nr:Rpn family recombination-promoting nuclease/putative transposase [Desulfovibrio sp.]